MTYKQTIERIAGRPLSEPELAEFTRDQWGLICSWLRENEGALTGYFPITSVSRADLENIGIDSKQYDDGDMKQLASKMADAYCDNIFWIDLPIIAEAIKQP
ncbi:MAG TPA: hypothetical protein VMV72_04875 [Verrucomicrobiae bacterium]|nr:hypothetical protein [Verrucomicrobiae bacterium]